MSCMREASPPLPDDNRHHDMKKRRFLQPLRGLRRIFRRKGRPVISAASEGNVDAVSTLPLRSGNEYYDTRRDRNDVEASNLEPSKSHSTSQLIEDQIDNSHRRSFQSTLLSVSHDSVFTSEQRSADSGSETSLCVHTRLGFPHSNVRAELFEAVRRRRVQETSNNVSDDEDLGLPRSPVSNSPTAADDMFTKENNIVTKSSQSTCSDGSLLSMGSSEIDEESYCQSSRNSSKLSLYDKRTSTGSDMQHIDRSTSSSLNGGSDASSLSHSAAKHKMAVKPKRNHGAPHKKRQLISNNTLPTTPELNEENGSKSVAVPSSSSLSVVDTRRSDEHQSNPNVGKRAAAGVVTVDHHHRSHCAVAAGGGNVTRSARAAVAKSSSLPPNNKGLVSPASSFRQLGRSGSNAASPSPDDDHLYDVAAAASDEKNPPVGKRGDGGASFFSRLLLRRSSKKKKSTNEETEPSHEDAIADEQEQSTSSSLSYVEEEEEQRQQRESTASYVNGGLNAAMKHHPMFRQRIEPLNLPTTTTTKPTAEPMYASTVPVNMDAGRVRKSFSFRTGDGDKLPLASGGEETTPSLPINVGLAEDRESSSARSSSRPKEYESVAAGLSEGGRSKTSTTPEYGNASPLNTLSINVNEGAEAEVDGAEEEWETKSKSQQTSEMKIPVPAPRTSLLGKTPSIGRLNDINDDTEKIVFGNTSVVVAATGTKIVDEPTTSLNVTITEIDDGQKSIISISSRPSLTSDGDPFETTTPPARPESIVTVHSSSDGEYADDVFLPVHESTRFDPTDTSGESTYETAPSNQSATSADAKAEPTIISKLPSLPNLPEPVSKPPILPTKPERIRPRSSGGGQKSEKPLAVVVSDPQTGTVKVNDAVVTMRKKSRPERDSCPAKSKDDDEPELMKVFARRSLKLKESDSVEDMLLEVAKSRDSDKENEDWNTVLSSERTSKRKDEPPETTPRLPFSKFQRSTSHEAVLLSTGTNENERRQRCKSTPNEREPESDMETKSEADNVTVEERTISTPFKRIQQRREEWEKRAQQAMKVHGAK